MTGSSPASSRADAYRSAPLVRSRRRTAIALPITMHCNFGTWLSRCCRFSVSQCWGASEKVSTLLDSVRGKEFRDSFTVTLHSWTNASQSGMSTRGKSASYFSAVPDRTHRPDRQRHDLPCSAVGIHLDLRNCLAEDRRGPSSPFRRRWQKLPRWSGPRRCAASPASCHAKWSRSGREKRR